MTYQHYDTAGRAYGLSKGQVSSLVNRHNLPKRKIYSAMAVSVADWESLMNKLQIAMLPSYTKAKQ